MASPMPIASGNKIFRSSRINNNQAIKPVVANAIITRLVLRLVSRSTSERVNNVLTTSAIDKYGKATLDTTLNFTEKKLPPNTDRKTTPTN